MIEDLTKEFLNNAHECTANIIVKKLRCMGFHHMCSVFGEYMSKLFPHNIDIRVEYATSLYYTGITSNIIKAYDVYKSILDSKSITEHLCKLMIYNQHFCSESVEDRFNFYNFDLVQKITRRKPRDFPMITVSITSCKRLGLFTQTVNSFINSCSDIHLVDKWFCVDDNSSEEDRSEMKKLFPFITFYEKTLQEKGHPQSMNIILEKVKTPYIFHLEDDWKFYERRAYLSECLEVLGEDSTYGQCVINKNYSELPKDHSILGGTFKHTQGGMAYYTHDYCPTEEERQAYYTKHGQGGYCCYWPHFSLRPSLIRRSVFTRLGKFNETVSHFEMDYAHKYVQAGYSSAFLKGIYSKHIGRLTTELNDDTKINAYKLNEECQFTGKEEKLAQSEPKESEIEPKNEIRPEEPVEKKGIELKLKTFVVNMRNRPDRWQKFLNDSSEIKFMRFNRFEAVDGYKLKSTAQLQRIFENNDYNMRRGMVGCALSHLKLCVELLNSEDCNAYCVFEDDARFAPDFRSKLEKYLKQSIDWDIIYLGYHRWTDDESTSDKHVLVKKDGWGALQMSMGGTFGYMITKTGAEKFLNFIDRTGMTNGIDTVQQKSANELNVYYADPPIVFSDCWRSVNSKTDTDIQNNYDSLSVDLKERLKEEIELHNLIRVHALPVDLKAPYYVKIEGDIKINHPYYTIEDENAKYAIVIPQGFHRFKNNGKWSIEKAIHYTE